MTSQDELPGITPYTFGTMSFGRQVSDLERDVKLARIAMETGVWFHTSQEYGSGGTFMVLRHAFDEARAQVPRLQVKVRCDSARTIEFDVHDALRRLGIERIDIVQLCRDAHDHRAIVDDFLKQGPMYETCQSLKAQERVGRFAFEIFPGFEADALKAMRHKLFDAAIFYYNPTQRHAPPAVWRTIRENGAPILALRTLGAVRRSLDDQAAQLAEKGRADDAARLRQLQPIFADAGCTDWLTFCVRFALSVPGVQTTIGGTANPAHFHALREAAEHVEPLPGSILDRVHALHDQWG